MSLSFEKLNENSKQIAYMYKDGKVEPVYINDIDDVDEAKRLTKIRLNNDADSFFPSITDINTKQNDRIYVCGPSGVGKSTFIRNYVIAFRYVYPKAKVLLFSSKKEDPALDDLKIERVRIDDDILVNPLTLQEIAAKSKPALCIFDDIQDFPNSKINKEIARLRDECMRNGRSHGIFTVYVWHDPADYKATKAQILEANKTVIFPRKAGEGVYKYIMDKYMYIPKKIQKIITKLKSKFTVVNKEIPRYVLTDKYIMLF